MGSANHSDINHVGYPETVHSRDEGWAPLVAEGGVRLLTWGDLAAAHAAAYPAAPGVTPLTRRRDPHSMGAGGVLLGISDPRDRSVGTASSTSARYKPSTRMAALGASQQWCHVVLRPVLSASPAALFQYAALPNDMGDVPF